MSRYFDRGEIEKKAEQTTGGDFNDGLSRSGGEKRSRDVHAAEEQADFGDNRRERIVFGEREYRIRPSEDRLMRDLGTFRVIREDDLVKGVYSGDQQLAQSDFRSLRRQGLLRSIRFHHLADGPSRVHTLSGDGYNVALSRSRNPPQFYYWGFVKPSEVDHDARLYQAYLHEQRRIRADGGSIKRVVLDVELKREHYSRTNKDGVHEAAVRELSARELQLPMVDGHVVFPDFRVEYEDERGEISRSDVEVATENYREKHYSVKAAAGFRIYASGGGVRVASGTPLKGNVFPQQTWTVYPL